VGNEPGRPRDRPILITADALFAGLMGTRLHTAQSFQRTFRSCHRTSSCPFAS
jgi:hypothetical protein